MTKIYYLAHDDGTDAMKLLKYAALKFEAELYDTLPQELKIYFEELKDD